MALTSAQLEKQKKEAEELLFAGPETLGFAKALFFGHFHQNLIFPYPELNSEQKQIVETARAQVQKFADEKIDARQIDKLADIPRSVIDGLAELGVLGMTAPKEFGGREFKQQAYCKIMEILGGHCASTAVFVNAHHSIGIRALLLFGTKEQQARWLPDLVSGKKLAAFALTEPNAGSDAANVQTTATPTDDGTGYVLNGQKRYITNAAIAQVLTVMARTPVPGKPNESRITAFLVTPDMPGFEVVEARAEKMGIRGTATGKLRFTNMRVPKENVLGQVGKGLRVALTVLDFGRTTFGASCTGAAKVCVEAMTKHAKQRVQFEQTLSEFELVKKKIAFAAAHTFAMEAMTQICAAFIDQGAEDYMLETAILKVFSTEHLWTIVFDCMQIFGGQSYFCNEPYERWMRDARINTIGEGANEVLKSFIAVVGCRGPGMQLDAMRKNMIKRPWVGLTDGMSFVGSQIRDRVTRLDIPMQSYALRNVARELGYRVKKLGQALPFVFLRAGTEAKFLVSQYNHERLADIAMDLYASSCVLSRLDYLLSRNDSDAAQMEAGKYFLMLAFDRIDQNFVNLKQNHDAQTTRTADAVIQSFK
ncbi:acyl-CoA dehydrogenase family protein [Telmatocola sphagniphila]|uniref:Acyl-CoA dehydrogenase family protein n=1 Tax=Telmatocola sphagniphila TaxID=1123043 RepID=A0A8E6B586_9BACT|nr:acyl-CoA dehydrogenase family protein [Telmatocola sphagniphila]QVL32173.1 acyl-CoA dehydrogenase family protein [Telmatocola sphagniphila]